MNSLAPQRYIFLPSFSLTPNKLVSFNSVFKRDFKTNTIKHISEKTNNYTPENVNITKKNKVTKQFHNFNLSVNAHRTLKKKINWLYYLSKSKHVKTYSNKEIYNFKMCFLTLTLPSTQKHCTKELNSILLNTFLTEIKERTGMKNYVWRLEFQKNGNAHWHLCTDTFLDYQFTLKIWNRILDNNGYILPYQEKFKAMSLKDYNHYVNENKKVDFKTIAKRYAHGKKTNWSQPPSIDVKSVVTKKSIANYISKYFSKNDDTKVKSNPLDSAENSKSIRLWFCSRSLSKLNTVTNFCEAVEYDIFAVISFAKSLKTKSLKYAKMFFFDIHSLPPRARKFIEKLLKSYAFDLGYVPSS